MGGCVKRHHKYTSSKKEGKKPESKRRPSYKAITGEAAPVGRALQILTASHPLPSLHIQKINTSDFMDVKYSIWAAAAAAKILVISVPPLLLYLRAIQTWQAKHKV